MVCSFPMIIFSHVSLWPIASPGQVWVLPNPTHFWHNPRFNVLQRRLSVKSKLSIYWSIHVAALTCGHELRVMTEIMRSRVQVAEMDLLRWVAGVTFRSRLSNSDIRKEYNCCSFALERASWGDSVEASIKSLTRGRRTGRRPEYTGGITCPIWPGNISGYWDLPCLSAATVTPTQHIWLKLDEVGRPAGEVKPLKSCSLVNTYRTGRCFSVTVLSLHHLLKGIRNSCVQN